MAAAFHVAAFFGISESDDLVHYQFEVSHKLVGFENFKAVYRLIRNHFLTHVSPVHELIAFVGRSRQSGGSAFGINASAFHSATVFRIGKSKDFEGVHREVGHVGTALGHLEGVAIAVGHHLTVLRPVDERVARAGCRRQRAFREVQVSACAFHGAALFGIGRNGDVVAVQLEVSHIGALARHSEAVGRRA